MQRLSQFVGLCARLSPNGEIAIYRPKKLRTKPLFSMVDAQACFDAMALTRAVWGTMGARVAWLAVMAPWALGLSIHSNSDKPQNPRPVYGQKGITSKGARTVRNAAFILQREAGRRRLTFSTVTLPSLSENDLLTLNDQWNKLIELYRLGMSRLLRKKGLSGEIVGVSEIQEKRYARSGLPMLHAHFVFVGCAKPGQWAVSPKAHDRIWKRAICATLGRDVSVGKSCCNLQCVKKDAAGYLGKYLSKGGKVIEEIKEDGFEWWLPRQWWNCSRSLSARVKQQTRRIFPDKFVELLLDLCESGDRRVWEYSRGVILSFSDGKTVAMATYGRLSSEFMCFIEREFPLADLPHVA